jgi:hypothetical protein
VTDAFVVQTLTMTASRIVTLPSAASVGSGFYLHILDESGSVTSTNTLVVTRSSVGSDLISGQTTYTISTAYGGVTLISDGVSRWTRVV